MEGLRSEIWVRTRIIDKEGEIVKEQCFRSKSFLLNYAKLMGAIFDVRSEDVVLYDGTTYAVRGGEPEVTWPSSAGEKGRLEFYHRVNAEDNDDSFGIMIGRGTTPISPEDYALADKIAHGVGAGLMDYEPCSVSVISYEIYPAPGWSRIIISRSFINLSGASIDVAEIGLGTFYRYFLRRADGAIVADESAKFLILRDVLPEIDTVPYGYTYTVSYEIRWSA